MDRIEFWDRPLAELMRSKRILLSQTDGELWLRWVGVSTPAGVGVKAGLASDGGVGKSGFFVGAGWLQALNNIIPGSSRIGNNQHVNRKNPNFMAPKSIFYFTTFLVGWIFKAVRPVWEGEFPACALPSHHEEKQHRPFQIGLCFLLTAAAAHPRI